MTDPTPTEWELLTRLFVWANSPYIEGALTVARVHGHRADPAFAASTAALWSEIDAALAPMEGPR